MVVITGYYAKPDQVSKAETMARWTKDLFAGTSDCSQIVISSDHYHFSLIPCTGQCVQIPICL